MKSCAWRMRISPEHAIPVADYLIGLRRWNLRRVDTSGRLEKTLSHTAAVDRPIGTYAMAPFLWLLETSAPAFLMRAFTAPHPARESERRCRGRISLAPFPLSHRVGTPSQVACGRFPFADRHPCTGISSPVHGQAPSPGLSANFRPALTRCPLHDSGKSDSGRV